MDRRLHASLKNVVALLVGILLAVGLLEVGLRVAGFSHQPFYRPDPRVGAMHVAGAEGRWRREGDGHVRINPQGFRDDDFDLETAPSTFRIGVLGDSYTDAFQVDQEEIYVEIMERRLADCPRLARRPVEAMNFGVSGFGTTQEWLTWRHYASAYEPDLVLLAFTPGNDVRNNSRALEPVGKRPFAVADGEALRVDASFVESPGYRRRTGLGHRVWYALSELRVVQAVAFMFGEAGRRGEIRAARRGAAETAEPGLNDEAFRPPEDVDWAEAWDITERVIAALAQEVAAAGSRLVITSVSRAAQVDPDPRVRRDLERRLGVADLYYPERRLAELADRLGLSYLPLAPALADWTLASGAQVHGFDNTRPGMGHWNAEGHRWAGEYLAAAICELLTEAGDGGR